MFNNIIYLFDSDPKRAYVILIGIFLIFCLMVWISFIDIKKKSITFWKIIIVGSSTIIVPIFASCFCGCKYLKWFLIASFVLWVFLLFINIKYNNDKFIGKADIDILSALFSECICVSLWVLYVSGKYPVIKITQLWYLFFLYLLIGSLVFLFFVILISFIKIIIFKKGSCFLHLSNSKISMIPLFIPIAVMIPYNIMIM